MNNPSNAVLTSEENVRQNRDTYKNARRVDTRPQAIEPFDKDGVSASPATRQIRRL
jgi:hypothetical protein